MVLRTNKLSRCVLALAVLAIASGARAQDPWTLVGQGDTQILVLSEEGGQAFINNTQWVADNAEAKNIKFFTQLGDLVTHGSYGYIHEGFNTNPPPDYNKVEWNRAEAALSILDGTSVGWGTTVGNHELDWVDVVPGSIPDIDWWDEESWGALEASGFEEWKRRYGPATTGRYASMPQFRGASPNDLDHYFIYSAEGRDYLHLHLQLDVPDSTIAWAQRIIDANQGMPTLISTHILEGTAHGPPNNPYLSGSGRNSANQVWDKLIKDNSQIFMVLSGHTGEYIHQTRRNTAGKNVFTIVQDYATKDDTDNKPGWMRLYEFDEANSVIHVKTYSPTWDEFLTTAAHQFDLPLDFVERFGRSKP
ncbi:metallophosphoesterase [Pirellulales bacterium]|nr:metallophosphoesterase [Pirellulales bacterium]